MSHAIIDRLRECRLLKIDDRCARLIVSFVEQQLRDLDEPDQDQEWIRQRRKYLAQRWEDDFFLMSELVESPIEQLLGAFLLCINDGYNEVVFDIFPGAFPGPQFGTYFRCQNRVYEYRADFLFKVNCLGDYKVLVVEVDGHDFHERTKQQAAYDKSRNRALQRRGIHVIRFTGSEVYKNPAQCAEEVQDYLARLVQELLHAKGLDTKPRSPSVH